MLARSFRLRKCDIERLYKKGSSLRNDFLLVRFVKNRTKHSRFSVIISKAVLVKASARVRLKRKTYILLEELRKEWPVEPTFDIALTYKGNPKEEVLIQKIKEVLSQIKGVR